MGFFQNNFHHELLPHRRFQLSQFCVYGHKTSQGYSIMTDNLKRVGELMSSKKPTMQGNKKSPARYMPANCAEISKVTSGGAN